MKSRYKGTNKWDQYINSEIKKIIYVIPFDWWCLFDRHRECKVATIP